MSNGIILKGQLLIVLMWYRKVRCEINGDGFMFLHRLTRKPEIELMMCLLKLAALVKMLKMMGGRTACTSSLTWYFNVIMHFDFSFIYGKSTTCEHYNVAIWLPSIFRRAQLSTLDNWDLFLPLYNKM